MSFDLMDSRLQDLNVIDKINENYLKQTFSSQGYKSKNDFQRCY